jgi:anti-sigma B factor antagonist
VALLKSKQVDDVLMVGFSSGKLLDESVIQQVGAELIDVASKAEQGQKLLLTFVGVTFMSSAMLGRLVLFLKKCKERGVELKVCSISPEIYEVFKLTKLNKTFDIQKDEEKALASFHKKGWFS